MNLNKRTGSRVKRKSHQAKTDKKANIWNWFICSMSWNKTRGFVLCCFAATIWSDFSFLTSMLECFSEREQEHATKHQEHQLKASMQRIDCNSMRRNQRISLTRYPARSLIMLQSLTAVDSKARYYNHFSCLTSIKVVSQWVIKLIISEHWTACTFLFLEIWFIMRVSVI